MGLEVQGHGEGILEPADILKGWLLQQSGLGTPTSRAPLRLLRGALTSLRSAEIAALKMAVGGRLLTPIAIAIAAGIHMSERSIRPIWGASSVPGSNQVTLFAPY